VTVLRRYLDRRAIPSSSATLANILGFGSRTLAGVEVSETTALRNMAVLRAVALNADTIAGFPIRTYRDRADSTSPAGIRNEVHLPLFQGEAYPDVTWFEWKELTLVHLLLWGNAYSLKVRNEGGDRVARVLPIHPGTVDVRRQDPRRTPGNPSGKEFRLAGQEDWLSPAEVMHIPGLGYDGVKGLSPIGLARQAIGVAVAAEEVAAKLFDSGLLNGGVLEAQRDITEDEAKAAKQGWRDRVSGIVRTWEVAIVGSGFKYIPATIPPREAQWLEARQFGVQEVARLYGTPPDLLMDNSATGNTAADQRAQSLVKFGLQHWVDRLENRMSTHLCPAGTILQLEMGNLLRGDATGRSAYYTAALDPDKGWMTRAEVRAAENLPPEEDQPEDPPVDEPAPPPVAPVPDPQQEDDGDEGTAQAAA
jgi:HK97 family phage portal protein